MDVVDRRCIRRSRCDVHHWLIELRHFGLLAEVVPRMTNQTLAQDPAEFRRKFKGLRQLYLRSHTVCSPGGTRAGEAVSWT